MASAFVAGRVDGVLLRELDEDDLSELGVDSGIARKKILLALAQLSDAAYDGAGLSGRSKELIHLQVHLQLVHTAWIDLNLPYGSSTVALRMLAAAMMIPTDSGTAGHWRPALDLELYLVTSA